jgi:biopolymer transport protein ExbD
LRLQARTKEEPEINLTSLIDVVFLLLIFFMVSTTFEQQAALRVDLPEASSVESTPDIPERLEFVIDDEGRMYLNDDALINSEKRTIRAAFLEAVGDERGLPIILRADRETPHHFVVSVMDVAAELGFVNLSIAANRVEDEVAGQGVRE